MRKLLTAIVLALSTPFSAQADALRELRSDHDIHGFEAVGRIDFQSARGGSYCTGTLVTPSLVLTAAHCLFDEVGNAVPMDGITFRAGMRNGRSQAERGVRRMVIHPEFNPRSAPDHATVATDVALLELNRAVPGARVRPLSGTGHLAAGAKVGVVSYARGRSETPSLEEACNVLDRDARVLVLDCDATFGASGAPVFLKAGDEYKIVSVISAGGRLGDRQATYAVTVETGLSALMAEFSRTPTMPTVRKFITTGAPAGAEVATVRRIAQPGDRTGAGGSIRFIRPGG